MSKIVREKDISISQIKVFVITGKLYNSNKRFVKVSSKL